MSDSATQFLKKKIGDFVPQVGLILGSGLGFLGEHIEIVAKIPYTQIPGFPAPTVEGHQGNLIFGQFAGKPIACMQGRYHSYEGYSLKETVKPLMEMIHLGIESLIVTNASGGINPRFSPGDFMVIEDHINMLGDNPLIGRNHSSLGPRFPDMTAAYSCDMRKTLESVAKELNTPLQRGVYLATSGPCFETPAEVRAYGILGADAVGMSTVPEVIIANHAKISVCGISCITNKAAGLSGYPLSHEEVQETADRVKDSFAQLISRLVAKL